MNFFAAREIVADDCARNANRVRKSAPQFIVRPTGNKFAAAKENTTRKIEFGFGNQARSIIKRTRTRFGRKASFIIGEIGIRSSNTSGNINRNTEKNDLPIWDSGKSAIVNTGTSGPNEIQIECARSVPGVASDSETPPEAFREKMSRVYTANNKVAVGGAENRSRKVITLITGCL